MSEAMHVLPDVLQPGLKVVFCGTAASRVSAAVGAYYAGPGNAFWPTLYQVGLTPVLLDPQAFQTVTRCGIGLTDLAKYESGVDSQLSAGAFDVPALRARIMRWQPRFLAFTSKTAAQTYWGHAVSYGWQPDSVGETQVIVLPSPSGAARRYWDITWWQVLADSVRQL